MPYLYCIETLECGVWDVQDTADSLETAIWLASALCCCLPDDRIRIATPDFRYL